MPCPACAASNLVHDDVTASLVCADCGTIADASPSLLLHDNPPTTILPPRNAKGWHLLRTKQDRDRKNAIAMNTFIGSVLSRLKYPALSPRAEHIFTRAMATGNYRWGRKANLVAGASIVIALREARKSDSLRDIAFYLDDSPVSLARTFQSVVSLLGLSPASTDPAVHLPVLQAHLQSAMSSEEFPILLFMIMLPPFSLDAVVTTATSLSHVVLSHTPSLPIASLPTPPTACALFILGLEAEARVPLQLQELSPILAARFQLSPGVVSSRYKTLYNLIEQWIRDIPWLNQFKHNGPGRRSKEPKRAIVAKGIKDVIQFHQEIWSRRMQHQQKVSLVLESDSDQEQDQERVGAAPSSRIVGKSVRALPPRPPPQRKRGKKGNAMQTAHQLLSDPSSSRSLDVATFSDGIDMVTHLLTCPPDELTRARQSPPTRLQRLAAVRGGSTPSRVADEELFADGELEGMLRNAREREAVLPLFQLNWGDAVSSQEAEASARQLKPVTTETKRGAKRVDMDALARLLGGQDDRTNEELGDAELPDSDTYEWGSIASAEHLSAMYDAESVRDWRPASNDDEFVDSSEDRYEEEI